MKVPQLPSNEKERLNALYHLNILDTEEEERFDRITRIAQKLFHVPIALISLIDVNRQWFKSCQGLDVKETSRDVSFCGHTICKNDIMVVEDASKDERFCDNPLVLKEPQIRFYMGCPINIAGSYNIGTLCLIDKMPHKVSLNDLQVLKDLVGMIQDELNTINLSTTDELTGLFNRRGFFMVANHLLSLFKRTEEPVCLLFFDLNDFKAINDTFGHASGDEVLKFYSQSFLKIFRKSDVVARLGGDEFCILFAGKKNKVDTILKRLNDQINTFNIAGQTIQYSVGCIEYDRDKHDSIETMLAAADDAMYKNKKS